MNRQSAIARLERDEASRAGSRRVVVGIAELRVSVDPQATLVTYGLGSCIAVTAHDPVRRVGGLLHLMLPDSAIATERARANSAMFADLGIPKLLRAMADLGCVPKDLVLKAAGGGTLQDRKGVFNIGDRNCAAMRATLARLGLSLAGEDVGGNKSRNVRLHVGTGSVIVRARGSEVRL